MSLKFNELRLFLYYYELAESWFKAYGLLNTSTLSLEAVRNTYFNLRKLAFRLTKTKPTIKNINKLFTNIFKGYDQEHIKGIMEDFMEILEDAGQLIHQNPYKINGGMSYDTFYYDY